MRNFSIEEALSYGWSSMTNNFGTMLMYMGIPIVATIVLELCVHFALEQLPSSLIALKGLSIIANMIIGAMATTILVRVALKLHDENPLLPTDLVPNLSHVTAYISASILVGLKVLLGFLLLIVPGVIWQIQREFFPFFIVDQDARTGESISNSIKITKDNTGRLFLFGLICFVINSAGLICLVVGIIPAIMVTFMASVHVYRELLNEPDKGREGRQLVLPG